MSDLGQLATLGPNPDHAYRLAEIAHDLLYVADTVPALYRPAMVLREQLINEIARLAGQ